MLIEVLFALFLLTLGAVTGFAVLSHSIRTFPGSRQELIAANLAQEAIEVARGIRDAKLLAIADKIKQGSALTYPGDSWAGDLLQCANPYRKRLELIDKNDLSKGSKIDNGCAVANERPYVYLEPITGFYANLCQSAACPNGWVDSGFRRLMDFQKYVCSNPPSCTALVPDSGPNACDTTNTCYEVRVKVKVYWGTDVEPAESACPSDKCIIAEDRFTDWVDYLESFL